MTNSVILEKVTKIYSGAKHPAIKDISLEIKKGEFFCFVGPSGCGKSTTLKIIAGLEQPTEGNMTVDGKVAMVFQSGALFPWLNVRQNVEFGMKMLDLSQHKIAEQAARYIDLVDLREFANKYPRELSGGQRQRVGLARALAIEPDILLLDEPFSALDTLTTEELHSYLLKIWKETQKTIVMVSHLLEEALLLSDRVGVMKSGELIEVIEVPGTRPRKENENSQIALKEKIKDEFKVT